jgi:hypothetical protein
MDEYLRVVARGSDHVNEYYWSNVFDKYEPLKCKECGKDLLGEGQGVVAFVEPLSSSGGERSIDAVYAACKGKCDRVVRSEYRDMGYGTFWMDLEDVTHPHGFMGWDMAVRNQLRAKREVYSDEAFEIINEIMLKISQKVLRMPTPEERDKYLEDQRWRDLGPL